MLLRFVGGAFKPRQTDVKAAQMETSAVNLFSHRLKTLLEDGEFVLCRSGQPIDVTVSARAALVVMPRSEHPRSQVVRMLEHEYSLRDALDPVWAIRPVALTTHEGRAALLLEDPGGELLVERAGTPMDLGDVLRTGAGVAAALRHLHARGLIHKDVKPANVMIDSSRGHAWLRGFGIASRVPRERRLPEPPEVIAGTLAYMAPEQTGWMNRSIDARQRPLNREAALLCADPHREERVWEYRKHDPSSRDFRT